MKEELNNYDWEEVFGYNSPDRCVKDDADTSSFSREDVAEIIGMEDGYNDGDNWIGLFRLLDGRFVFIRAGCDYTGWDCQQWGQSHVAKELQDLIRFGMSLEERGRLKCLLEEEK